MTNRVRPVKLNSMSFIFKALMALFLFCGQAQVLWAYPQFIGHGHHSCLTCHYNPHGAGALNDYGRALGATKISARWFHDADKTEEQIAEESGFLYRKPDTTWLRTALKYRGLGLKKAHGTDQSESEYIHMLARAQLTLKFGERDQLLFSGNLDYAPDPRGNRESDESNYRSREHYLGWRPFANFGIYAGLMDKVFGIRVPDHIAFSRVIQNTTMNDQTHGVVGHLIWNDWEFGLQSFVGNLAQDEQLRQKGVTTKTEYLLAPRVKIGGSLLYSKSEIVGQQSLALHARMGFAEGSSVLIEAGQRKREVFDSEFENTARYLFTQGHLHLQRGLYLLNTVELLQSNTENKTYVLRVGPGLQVFMHKGFELRFDFYNTRVLSEEAVPDDTWDLTGQVHLWF